MKAKCLIGIILIILTFGGCKPKWSYKSYEFAVKNQLPTQTIKIIPKNPHSDFWITSNEEYVVVPHETLIIGSIWEHNRNKKAKEVFDEIIVPFDLYVDDIKQEDNYSKRSFWTFSLGVVDESGKYLLIIDENTIKID